VQLVGETLLQNCTGDAHWPMDDGYGPPEAMQLELVKLAVFPDTAPIVCGPWQMSGRAVPRLTCSETVKPQSAMSQFMVLIPPAFVMVSIVAGLTGGTPNVLFIPCTFSGVERPPLLSPNQLLEFTSYENSTEDVELGVVLMVGAFAILPPKVTVKPPVVFCVKMTFTTSPAVGFVNTTLVIT